MNPGRRSLLPHSLVIAGSLSLTMSSGGVRAPSLARLPDAWLQEGPPIARENVARLAEGPALPPLPSNGARVPVRGSRSRKGEGGGAERADRVQQLRGLLETLPRSHRPCSGAAFEAVGDGVVLDPIERELAIFIDGVDHLMTQFPGESEPDLIGLVPR